MRRPFLWPDRASITCLPHRPYLSPKLTFSLKTFELNFLAASVPILRILCQAESTGDGRTDLV
jgi:hypothetical protein